MAQRPPPPPIWHRELVSHGVTGTNGKTSTVGLLAAALSSLGAPVPSVTTLGAFIDEQPFEAPADHEGLLRTLAAGLARGARHAVLELTSEALALGYARAWPCVGGVFTNLSHDHLDAHQSPEHYLASKAQLFMALPAHGYAVLNGCDPSSLLIAEVTPPPVRRLYYGAPSRGEPLVELQLRATRLQVGWHGSAASLEGQLANLPARLVTRAIGPEHIENAMAALGAAILAGVDTSAAAAAIAACAPRPGRFEVVGTAPHVVVDFAHSPDALERTLATARSLCRGQLWLVFGAGGRRDRDKRPLMGQAARGADHVLLTSDNCRDENPRDICAAIARGLGPHPSAYEELDRELAIRTAITRAAPTDVVLIAGRGPERQLDLGTRRLELADADAARAALRERC